MTKGHPARPARAPSHPRTSSAPRFPKAATLRRAATLLAFCLLGSCLVEHHARCVPTDALLPWLQPGKTTRTDVLQALGAPSRRLEAGRILLWELNDDGIRTSRTEAEPRLEPYSPFPSAPYSLVIVIEGELVGRASLVRVWR